MHIKYQTLIGVIKKCTHKREHKTLLEKEEKRKREGKNQPLQGIYHEIKKNNLLIKTVTSI